MATITSAGPQEMRGSLKLRRLEVTDGHTTLPLVLFGKPARGNYRPGQRIRVGPVYWSEQWGNFSLQRGGSVATS